MPRVPWWRDAVIYEVYVRSFADADGDGIGDLPGVADRLPYIAGLGVDGVWLTPFYPSPMVDGGYDIVDYRSVDPRFGTLADLDRLIARAHELGLRVLVDIVPNHTSSAHPWFQRALAAPPQSPARRRYVFRPGRGRAGELPPTDWESFMGGPAWTPAGDGEWYLHLFTPEQPDLNWVDPQVHAEFAEILRFWLDRGIDGFRIDAAHRLVEVELEDATKPLRDSRHLHWDQRAALDVYREWREILDSYPGERIAVAEAWLPAPEQWALFLRPHELHQAFDFTFLTAPWSAPALRSVVDRSLAAVRDIGATTTWVLANHDVERQVTRYGGGEVGLRRARAAALLMLALPGAAYLYQGEELGLPEVTDLPDDARDDPVWRLSGHTRVGRDGCRVPMPWGGDDPPFGFGADGSWLPVPPSWRDRTVAAQEGDPTSTLSLYRAALRLRRRFRDGEGLRWLSGPPETLAFTRPSGLTCAVNIGDKPAELATPGTLLLASSPVEVAGDRVVLAPDCATWWQGTPARG